LAERSSHPFLRLMFAITMIGLAFAALEMAMRYLDRPHAVVSGWRATESRGPLNQFGFRGRPGQLIRSTDFVVLLTGGGAVECPACPPDETLDLMLERELRRYNPNVRVITLGSQGYSQDQEYLALHDYFAHRHAELVVNWASIAEDVPANTFRSGQPRPGLTMPKPTFALAGADIAGPTEAVGDKIYRTKLTTILRPMFIDLDRNWTILLPKAEAGSASAPPGAETQAHVDDALEQQRSAWSIWLTPRPARVKYGIELTRALLRHMRDLSRLQGAPFVVMLTPESPSRRTDAAIALEHEGYWFLADPATRDAAVGEVTTGFDTITIPGEDAPLASPQSERQMMARLAEALNQRDLLATPERPRH